ncbi:MAG TPA: anhydro-N-acetylmuramic acid kinase [Burkholderiaceae bacterium]|nr:anhydro-N-acetylmuramic acid kinase [Burkholderiaceae bacterium]
MSLFLGLMSGTSLDGVDAVAVEWVHDDAPTMQVGGHVHHPFDGHLRDRLLALNAAQPDELEKAGAAAIALARAYADAVQDLLSRNGLYRDRVRAIGAHGQTVRHCPQAEEGGFSIQLLNGAVLAEACGIDVVCDFRSRDLAAGGQGAPLVPAFHAGCFARRGEARAVLNLGGIANVTLLHADGRVAGFDTGPANVLLDAWAGLHRGGVPYDAEGRWAASGRVDEGLLQQMLSEPYFGRSPPKSTGRDLFQVEWLKRHLDALGRTPATVDIQATLVELTVRSVADALQRHLPDGRGLWVCGGGALNAHLMARLAAALPQWHVQTTDTLGLPPMQVEAVAFAWLAREFVERRAAGRPEVTGAKGSRMLGCLYPA